LGPDVDADKLEYVAWQCDQDAYACSGQKCSAQSLLVVHKNWARAGLYDKLASLAARRKLDDLTCGPVLTWTTAAMQEHVAKLLEIPGARVLFGGKELPNHSIPKCYGALEPTAVFVPLRALKSNKWFALATTEVFGPLQVVTEFTDATLPTVLNVMERINHHLTAAVVSNDVLFKCVHLPLLQP
jgi:1-pyrroline-5-carboxylate dehydrogenase